MALIMSELYFLNLEFRFTLLKPVWAWHCLLLTFLPRGHPRPWNDLSRGWSRIWSHREIKPPSRSTDTFTIDYLRVPACLAIIPHQSLKAFDWNKKLRVMSRVQITLIQACVAQAGHDWVIRQQVTFFIAVINVSASALREGWNWWMGKHSVCFPISHHPSWYHPDKLSNIWR